MKILIYIRVFSNDQSQTISQIHTSLKLIYFECIDGVEGKI